jgi:DNA polymerase-3 subunit gamma/tau
MADKNYLVLARKWRPQRFDDVVGQEHITRTLKNAIAGGRIHHAFLFIGSRGIGKTTTARILARALNCLAFDAPTPEPCGACDNCKSIMQGSNIDVIEIDGASNNGVDNVREIRDNIRMVPTHGRYKVYIIDEVHQLSAGAFNALLKTLEEPPPHAVFILATTEAHKIPATIVSRCQRMDFRRVPVDTIIALLRNILAKENLSATEEALYAIARAAEGGIRDAESILDELITYCDGPITFEAVNEVLGLVDWDLLHGLADAIDAQDIAAQLRIVEQVAAAGKDLGQFVEEVLRYFRNLLVCKTEHTEKLLALPEEDIAALKERAQRRTYTSLIRIIEQFAALQSSFDSQLSQRIALEALLIKISKAEAEISVDTILDRLMRLSEGGVILPAPNARPPDPPEAGAISPARTRPATTERITLHADNLRIMWPDLTRQLMDAHLNLGVQLSLARAERVAGGVVHLAFESHQSAARDMVEAPAHREIITRFLAESTANVTDFATTLLAPRPSKQPERPMVHAELPIYSGVDPKAAREALAAPGVQTLLGVFKGRIAKIAPAVGGTPATLPGLAPDAGSDATPEEDD